jgi:HEAT repeat protein
MSHPEAGVRGTVASALEHFPDANEAAAHLASMAEDEDPYVRNSVLRAQCTLDIPDEVKVAQCLKRIDDWGGYDDWVPADNALWYLSNVGAAAAPALSALIAAVQQQQRCVDDILEVLHNVGPAARLALPLLRARLNEQLEWDPLMEDEDTVRLDMLIKELEK